MLKYCPGCSVEKDSEQFYRNKRNRDGLCGYCKPCWNAYTKKRETTNPRKYTGKEYYRDLKDKVIERYGHTCACCGETLREFLTLDHVNKGGGKHRKERGSNAHYMDAKRRNFPPDYRVLCFNCNCVMAHGQSCPHELERQGTAA